MSEANLLSSIAWCVSQLLTNTKELVRRKAKIYTNICINIIFWLQFYLNSLLEITSNAK